MTQIPMTSARKSLKHDPTGVIYSLNYDLHVDHLVSELAKLAGPDLSASLRKVNIRVAAGKATRVQALSYEIARLEAN